MLSLLNPEANHHTQQEQEVSVAKLEHHMFLKGFFFIIVYIYTHTHTRTHAHTHTHRHTHTHTHTHKTNVRLQQVLVLLLSTGGARLHRDRVLLSLLL